MRAFYFVYKHFIESYSPIVKNRQNSLIIGLFFELNLSLHNTVILFLVLYSGSLQNSIIISVIVKLNLESVAEVPPRNVLFSICADDLSFIAASN